ncbi:hypothetical protein HYALB_00003303 [Hymenoscyphus albidus]|uniref:Uncharacterized protein n=1 Tax=Hymenoscyphus albidus TaxID=595503 RepID=A0A9N9LF23_9HELO|nr:hypothetical protein HYALB_00003303 [Hymenoscyphus albidus]
MPQPWASISNHGLFTHTNHVSSLRIGLSTVTRYQRRHLHSQATNASASDSDFALYAAKQIRVAEFLRKEWAHKIPQDAPRPVLQAELIRVQEEREPVWRYTPSLELPGGNFHKFSNINPNPHKAASILHSNVLASFLQQTPFSSPSQRQRYSDSDLMLLNFTKSWLKKPNATSFPIIHYERLQSGHWRCVVHINSLPAKALKSLERVKLWAKHWRLPIPICWN